MLTYGQLIFRNKLQWNFKSKFKYFHLKMHLKHIQQNWGNCYLVQAPMCWRVNHWGRMTHICVGKLTTNGSDNGLSPGRRQAIIWAIAGKLLRGPLGKKLPWNFNPSWNIFIQENAFGNAVCEVASILSRSQCVKQNKNLKKKKNTHWHELHLNNALKIS